MRRALLLLLLAPLALAAPPSAKKALYIRVKTIEPQAAMVGQKVTVTGENLDVVNALVLGSVSPQIVEKTAAKLVFLVPRDPVEPSFSAPLFLLSPGRRVVATQLTMTVSDGTVVPPTPPAGDVILDEDSKIAAGKPKRYELTVARAPSIEVVVQATGGDLEARVEPLDPPGEAVTDATESGHMRWRVNTRQLGANGKPPKKIAVVFSSDADVSFHAKVTRYGAGAAANRPD